MIIAQQSLPAVRPEVSESRGSTVSVQGSGRFGRRRHVIATVWSAMSAWEASRRMPSSW
jgi:hypothetical protein